MPHASHAPDRLPDRLLAPPDTALDAGPRDVLHGYAQKGPFVAGSRVSIIALDSELFPTGVTYMTETVGALGEYEMRTLPPGFYQVEVTGEVTRDFDFSRTGTERTLRAIVQTHVRGAFDASVTLITHLTTPRIRVLVRGGVELEAARAQAERELFTGLDGLTQPGFDPGVVGTAAVATSADSPGSRWLLFLSSQLHESATVDVDSVADDLRDGTSTIRNLPTCVARPRPSVGLKSLRRVNIRFCWPALQVPANRCSPADCPVCCQR